MPNTHSNPHGRIKDLPQYQYGDVDFDTMLDVAKGRRFKGSLIAMDFPTQDAYDKYMKEHPDADKSKHTVKETQKEPAKKEPAKKHDVVELTSIARKKYKGNKLFGGNCGQFALGLAKHLIDIGAKDVKLGLITEKNDDLDGNDVDELQKSEPKIYHVFVQHGGKWYDGSGEIDEDYISKFAQERYGDDNPDMWIDIAVDDKARKLIEWETDWDISWDKFHSLFSGKKAWHNVMPMQMVKPWTDADGNPVNPEKTMIQPLRARRDYGEIEGEIAMRMKEAKIASKIVADTFCRMC
jgi:hypothetical protein